MATITTKVLSPRLRRDVEALFGKYGVVGGWCHSIHDAI